MFKSTLSTICQLCVGLAAIIVAVGFARPDVLKTIWPRMSHVVSSPAPTPAHDEKTRRKPGVVALSADRHGHFGVSALIDGKHVELLADTGASMVALTYEDARRIGLDPDNLDFSGRISTANGIARIAPVTLASVTVGPITVRNVRAAVAEPDALGVNLLGMSFIGALSKFELKGRQLVLHR